MELIRTGENGTAGVRVGWHQGGVQLASLAETDREGSDPGNGRFVDLDRSDLNRLIRVLRRARDQAYGRDE